MDALSLARAPTVSVQTIDLCGGDVLCMKPADRLVTVYIEAGGKATSQRLNLCTRHLSVMQEHAAKRCAEDPTLTIRFTVTPRGAHA